MQLEMLKQGCTSMHTKYKPTSLQATELTLLEAKPDRNVTLARHRINASLKMAKLVPP